VPSHISALREDRLTRRRGVQVIAPLLIVQRVASKTALTSNTDMIGNISSFKARDPAELTGGSVSLDNKDPNGSVVERGTNSDEFSVDTLIGIHRDSDV